MNLEKATRNKYRFPSPSGMLTIEDLWELPLLTTKANRPCLDDTARTISRDLKSLEEESFVDSRPNPFKAELADKLEIVKYIISVRQAENAAAADAGERKRQKDALVEILHIRTQQDLMSKTPAEIEAMIAALEKPQ